MAQPTTHWVCSCPRGFSSMQEPEGRMFEPGTPASGAQTTQRATASSISQQILGELPSPPPPHLLTTKWQHKYGRN